MHFHIADAYIDAESPLHALDPRVKVALTILMILLINLTPMGAFGAYVAFFAIMMAGAVIARIDPLMVARRSLIALLFAGAAVTLVFTVPGPTLGTVPLTGWPISEPGLVRFVSILFKSMISVQAATLLVATTHFTDMLWALGALRVPAVLVAIISFMYRYIFVLVEEAIRLQRARDSRSAVIEGKGPSLLFQAQTTGRMIGSLLVRGFARSERVYQAMVARGYQGEMKVINPPKATRHDLFFASIPLVAGLGLLVFSLLLQ
jgi:cobalt/nickel transport system permease protein